MSISEFFRMFKDSLYREELTNLTVKGAKRCVKMWTTNFYKIFFKNILLYMIGRLSKIRSLHTYAMHRMFYFESYCRWRPRVKLRVYINAEIIWKKNMDVKFLQLWKCYCIKICNNKMCPKVFTFYTYGQEVHNVQGGPERSRQYSWALICSVRET